MPATFITGPHNHKKPPSLPNERRHPSGRRLGVAVAALHRLHYTFRVLLILESKTYANEAAAWFYKARNFVAQDWEGEETLPSPHRVFAKSVSY